MIKVGSNQKIAFDIKEALSFDGFTAPYLQYSLARINSILKKNKIGKKKVTITTKACVAGKSFTRLG
jgi:arginyl-tRNA synthetase